ncbi:tRNA pseudouridine(13) synthase TruD [Beggiatoa leptomitoformis]|uniref:tRNA pseudouridine synthase D n=1 Tax=Beggiatoa leptomitoformis TaxID=288004 RepID=A0A2N9YD39_9GAMM|nr:tRNA pseudouridine(13) synthase TruD [Beggiatoa leptomitoformis]ALG69568.2 tRNA pseudouridine(13) synthase TruD [Beggiatoa leptomitoformis]AUI68356.1 tRNA pseudouridine(13) synthase TruD [Beggiatoa leptomitoformis]
MIPITLPDFAYILGAPTITADVRTYPEDFQVVETLSFEPTGTGEHVFLQIRKRDTNTDWLARQLAQFANVKPHEVSYAGLKDRHAVTTQWFSIQLAGKIAPDWQTLNSDTIQVVQQTRHSRKLRRGALRDNQFILCLRNVTGNHATLEQRLTYLAQHGVPNYFGEQRFGHNHNNLQAAEQILVAQAIIKDRHQRSLYLSAARSFLFNRILSERVTQGSWNQAINGDVMQLAGSHSVFPITNIDDEIQRRLTCFDIHPAAPLWGKGENLASLDALALMQTILSAHQGWCEGLIREGLELEWRSLRLIVENLQWTWLSETSLQLAFHLPAGAYATTVLRELVKTTEFTRHVM